MADTPKGREALSTIVLHVPGPLKGRWVQASRKRGMKLNDWLMEQVEKGQNMIAYKIPDTLASQYHGAGWALAAITGDQVTALRYLRDVAPAIADEIDAGGAHDAFFVRQWINSQEAGPVVRELQALGQVSVGMCSAWEFCEL